MLAVVSVAQLLCCHSDYQLFGKPLRFLHGCACALSAAVSAVASGDAFPATQRTEVIHHTLPDLAISGSLWMKLKCIQEKRTLWWSNPIPFQSEFVFFFKWLGVPSHFLLILLLCFNCLLLLDKGSSHILWIIYQSPNRIASVESPMKNKRPLQSRTSCSLLLFDFLIVVWHNVKK